MDMYPLKTVMFIQEVLSFKTSSKRSYLSQSLVHTCKLRGCVLV